MRFRPEPSHIHGTPARTGIELVNLGTPDAPTAPAVRRYLKQFLSDPRVVEIPRLLWLPILYGLVLPLRASRSAAKYAAIWSAEGSPLRVHTEKQAQLLRGYLGERGYDVRVAFAMRYGNPGLPEVLDRLKADGCDRLLVLPAYPQYSGTTSASIFDAVFAHYATVRNPPELRLVKHYHDHDAYIEALTRSVQSHWLANGRSGKLVMSFHGVPKRTLLLGDPYHCECHKTARLLASSLGLAEGDYLVTFQSRFGKAEWLQPYTAPTLQKLAREGVERVDVLCPGFTSDCLETLEEIALEARQLFLAAGGKTFHYISCLNEGPDWIDALARIAEQHLAGWPCAREGIGTERAKVQAMLGRERARAMGAPE